MSHLVWYTNSMIIETDMRDKLFEVKIATCWNGEVYVHSTTTHIKAHDLAHAKRISQRKWRTTRVQPVEGRFERFKEFNR